MSDQPKPTGEQDCTCWTQEDGRGKCNARSHYLEPPNPTTGEWKPRHVQSICEEGYSDDLTPEQAEVIANAHNAALAAERGKHLPYISDLERQLAAERKASDKIAENARNLHIENVRLAKQLDAEREKVKVANTQCKTIAALMQDAEKQLSAEQEASRYWKEQWVERGAQLATKNEREINTICELQRQLAAEKQQAESMLATSKRVNDQLRSQVQPLVDALTEIRDRLKSPDVDVDFEWILEKSETALAKVK